MDTKQTDDAKARLYLTAAQLQNIVDNLHEGKFSVNILDDGAARDVSVQTAATLKIMKANIEAVLQGLS